MFQRSPHGAFVRRAGTQHALSAKRGLRELPRLLELVGPLAVVGAELGHSLLEALLPLIPRGFQLLLQGLDLGVALPLH